jgi:hypothetical protein
VNSRFLYLPRKRGHETAVGFLIYPFTCCRKAEQAEQVERRLEQYRLEQAYEEYVESETAKYISEKITETELTSLNAQKKKDLKLQFKSMTSEQLDALAQQTIVMEIPYGQNIHAARCSTGPMVCEW